MKRALIVYESIYGNTERVASAIAEGITESGDVECVIKKPGEIHTDELALHDAILFGAPNHNQEPARNIVKFIERATIVELEQKIGAVFDTYTGGNKGIAASKLEAIVKEEIPCIKIAVQSLSAKVEDRRGPLSEGEIERARAFGRDVAKAILTA
ncbi:MAG: flavodoxin family protein [Candidatus Thorarchaeota archaeon]